MACGVFAAKRRILRGFCRIRQGERLFYGDSPDQGEKSRYDPFVFLPDVLGLCGFGHFSGKKKTPPVKAAFSTQEDWYARAPGEKGARRTNQAREGCAFEPSTHSSYSLRSVSTSSCTETMLFTRPTLEPQNTKPLSRLPFMALMRAEEMQ